MKVLIADPMDSSAIEYLRKNNLEVNYQPQISAQELDSKISQYDAFLVRSRTKINKEVIEKGQKLKVVGRIGSGYDNIDISECKKRKIMVINAPNANSQSVAELTIGLMITLLRKVEFALTSMRAGKWLKNDIWGNTLSGKTVGIIGYGFVGKRVARILTVFDCKLLIFSRSYKTASLEKIFSKADIITVHLALNKDTKKLIDQPLLKMMNKNAFLINISRGDIIDEDALFQVLSEKSIAGAALDVFWQEPLTADSKWRRLKNVLLTPHIGAATIEALNNAGMTVAQDLVRVYKGIKPKYKVV